MNRLRHPVRAIREPFGTAGLVVACVALIAALGGTALAAAKLNSTQKKEVEKIAKKYAGKPGAPGAAGPQGPAGANGKDGAQGEKGAKGDTGEKGEKGAKGDTGSPGGAGKSVEALTIDTGEEACAGQGGAEYTVQGSGEFTQVCSGKEGSPWTAGGTLPPGASEAGAWAAVGGVQTVTTEVEGVKEEVTVGDEEMLAPISFPIRLPKGLSAAHVHYSTEANYTDFDEGGPSHLGCVASVTAPPGDLCVNQESLLNATFEGIFNPGLGAKSTGAVGGIVVFAVTGSPATVSGGFVVTAPCATGEILVEEETEPGSEEFKFFCEKAS
jgi:hypothetical protein